MELTQLRYFMAVAQCGSMSRAAEQLHVTQPALSKSLAKLEAELGCQLLDRQGRTLVLNDEGRLLLKNTASVMRDLDDTTIQLSEMSRQPVSRLHIGITGSDAMITDRLMAFAARHRDIQLNIECNIEAETTVDINRFDMLLYPEDALFQRFKGIPVGTERYLLAVPSTHRLAHAEGISIEGFQDERFVFTRHDRDPIEQPYELCLGAGIRPRVFAFTNSTDMHRQTIASGQAIGFVPEYGSAIYYHDPAICLLRICDARFKRTMMVCFKREKHLSPIGLELKEYITATLEE